MSGVLASLVLVGCATRNIAVNQALALRTPAGTASQVVPLAQTVPNPPVLPAADPLAPSLPQTDIQLASSEGHRQAIESAAVDSQTFRDVLMELEMLGTRDPAAQARLMEQLRKTHPLMVPALLKSYRLALGSQSGPAQSGVQSQTAEPAATLMSHRETSDLSEPRETDAAYRGESSPTDLERAIEQRERAADAAPSSADEVRRQVEHRFLCLAAGRYDDAARPIAGMTPGEEIIPTRSVSEESIPTRSVSEESIPTRSASEELFWSKALTGLATHLDRQRMPDDAFRTAQSAQLLDEAVRQLRPAGELVVRNLMFCQKVASFGDLTPLDGSRFKPGQKVLLYAEIDNFNTRESAEGFRTDLNSHYQIVDSQGQREAVHTFPATSDRCRQRRRDYFQTYLFSLPPTITDGRYTLELSVEDVIGGKIGRATVEFRVVSQ